MSASSRKTFITTTLLVMLGAGILFFLVTSPAVHNLFGSLTNTAGSAAAAGKASIADIAANYYGTLSRPLIPEVSGFLPFWVQVTISVIIMVLMLLVGLLFPKARGFLILLTAFAVGRNLVWRAVDTLNLTDPIHATLSIILYVAEISAFISLLLGYFQLYKPTERSGVPFVQHPNEPIPSVDVYLCTYNEPVSVLYRGLVGCQAMDYPNKTVYLLDDGNRPEMAKLAAHLGVEYISREKNTHAKAGNMNNAMKYTNGDLIVVFDADHVPARSFLKETVGFSKKIENWLTFKLLSTSSRMTPSSAIWLLKMWLPMSKIFSSTLFSRVTTTGERPSLLVVVPYLVAEPLMMWVGLRLIRLPKTFIPAFASILKAGSRLSITRI